MTDTVTAAAVNRVARAVEQLEETVVEFNKQSLDFGKRMLWLTWTIAGLAVAQLFVAGYGIWSTLRLR